MTREPDSSPSQRDLVQWAEQSTTRRNPDDEDSLQYRTSVGRPGPQERHQSLPRRRITANGPRHTTTHDPSAFGSTDKTRLKTPGSTCRGFLPRFSAGTRPDSWRKPIERNRPLQIQKTDPSRLGPSCSNSGRDERGAREAASTTNAVGSEGRPENCSVMESATSSAATPGTLVPPAVTSLRASMMERTPSEDIREEREELQKAVEQTLNVIMDLDLGGNIRWVSPSWVDVIGTTTEPVQGMPITDYRRLDSQREQAGFCGCRRTHEEG